MKKLISVLTLVFLIAIANAEANSCSQAHGEYEGTSNNGNALLSQHET